VTRHLLDVTDFDPDEIRTILDLAGVPIPSLGRPLEGSGVALIFEKPSNRTRHSTEMAVVQLGGHPIYTRGEEVGFDTREPVEDVARIMAGYHAVIAARVFDHTTLLRMARAVDVPLVNMLSDWSHPLQALADALTMQQRLGDLGGKTVAYVGDYNNVARSLSEISLMLGAHVRLACPVGFAADDGELERLALIGTASTVAQSHRPTDAVAGAHAVHTDTWVSMGKEAEKELRRQQFEGYMVDVELMSAAAEGAVFMHCLPAYRGMEIATEVLEGPQSVVWDEAENRRHAQKAVLTWLLGAAS